VLNTVQLIRWPMVAAIILILIDAVSRAGEEAGEAKPKHTIKEVMQGAHVAKEGEKSLRDIVIGGQATPEQKQLLLDLYISLAENKPPRGELAAFRDKTRLIVLAAAKIVVGREGASDELGKATNCAACHKDHKPPQQ
jgi:hypothetical protein